MIRLELCTTYSSNNPVVTTTSIILCFNKHRLTKVHLEKWPLKWRERDREMYVIIEEEYHDNKNNSKPVLQPLIQDSRGDLAPIMFTVHTRLLSPH